MTIASTNRTLLAVFAAAAVLAPFASAAGEPKNEFPFNRSIISGESHTIAAVAKQKSSSNLIAGEPKNVLPFTRR